jgi:hypothetical protein
MREYLGSLETEGGSRDSRHLIGFAINGDDYVADVGPIPMVKRIRAENSIQVTRFDYSAMVTSHGSKYQGDVGIHVCSVRQHQGRFTFDVGFFQAGENR